MKLSFSISSKSSTSRSNAARKPQSSQPTANETEDKSRFVTVFDPSETLTAGTSKPVIEPLENTNQWRATKRMKNLVPPSDPSDTNEADRFVVDRLGVDAADGDTTKYGLNLRSKVDGGDDGGGDGGDIASLGSEAIMSDDQRFRVDIESLPEDRGMDEFVDVSVEDFSKAVLEGYGWKEGQGIGRNSKADIPIVEQKRWAGTSGLGFTSDLPTSGKEAGRNNNKEKPPLPPSSSNGAGKNNVVRVISGKYAGLKGEILKTSGRSDRETVVLSMLNSSEKVSVGFDMIAELGSVEEERCLRKLKELDVRDGDRSDRRMEKRSRGYEQGGVGESKHDSRMHHSSSDVKGSDSVSWIRSLIRVRVVSRSIKGGSHYLKKGVITDVIGPMTCDIKMDESRELLQCVDQEILETVLPQRGGPVLVLYGRHKGVFGKLMEKDKDKETAIVQDEDSHELIKVRMEQIAEYVGDPGAIGY